MNNVQKIVHKSRNNNFTFNWEASDSGAWSFTAQDDGEIYADEKTNISSYTINGIAATLPYAIIKNNSYSIIPTKTTGGLIAELTLKTRRNVDKTFSISVPVFSIYSGQYLYVLMNNNEVWKYDCALLKPSNYVGAGVWTVDPKIATIVLPTLPNSAKYTALQFVKSNGVEKIFACGGTFGMAYSLYASFIIISTDLVYNMAETTLDSYTVIASVGSTYSSPSNILYDYINEYLYISSGSGPAGWTVTLFNLNTLIGTNLGYSQFASSFISNTGRNQFQFIPEKQWFSHIGDLDLINSATKNYKNPPNSGGVWGYKHDTNNTICTGDTFGKLNFINLSGSFSAVVNYGTIGVFSCSEIKGYYRSTTAFMTYINNYALVDWGSAYTKIRATDKGLASPNNYILNLLESNSQSIYLAFSANSAKVLSTRMLIFDKAETNADFGYYDFTGAIPLSAVNNQLIV